MTDSLIGHIISLLEDPGPPIPSTPGLPERLSTGCSLIGYIISADDTWVNKTPQKTIWVDI